VNRTIVQLRAEGYGIDEIAEAVQLSYKQVESRIYRVRQKLGRTKESTYE
jgi:DNA-directed RNA polymerase specialized sigma24 family protein